MLAVLVLAVLVLVAGAALAGAVVVLCCPPLPHLGSVLCFVGDCLIEGIPVKMVMQACLSAMMTVASRGAVLQSTVHALRVHSGPSLDCTYWNCIQLRTEPGI